MRTPVLATKLFAPARRPALVPRQRLIDRLDAALEPGRRLTLVSAPAGFGKTTAIAGWAGHSAWLSLDDGDNDLPRLLTHLVAAMRVGDQALDLLPDTTAVLNTLINEVAGTAGRIVLVLDDYHVISAAAVHEAVTYLLDHLPPQLHLVIASRSDPPLPLSRLRSRDELVEVRAADLRFTAGEATSFLNSVMGLGLSTPDVEALEARTEGWITGLQLVALSLRGRADVSEFVGAFTGSDRFVLDYLVDEVLQRQPPAVREFLLHTAVLDRLTGPLCDAVTGRDDGGAMLEMLDRANLFVVPLDDRRAWSRYHHLFGDVLRARLLGDEPGLVAVLHRRASDWFEHHELPEDAVRHALAARDFDRAAYRMELALPALRRHRQDGLLLAWLEALPDEVVRRSAVLSVFAGWRRLLAGDLDGLETRLDDAERVLAEAPPDEANEELRTLPITMATYRAALAQARGDRPGMIVQARRALELAGPGDHFARGAAGGFLGLAAWADGDVQTALRVFGDAVRSLGAAGNVTDELSSTTVLADIHLAAGRPRRARELHESGLRRATALPAAAADLHVGLSELDRELGDLAAARRHLEAAAALGEGTAVPENRHRWFVAMALLRAAEGDPEEAVGLLDEAERLHRRGFVPDVRPIAALRARIRIDQGRLAEAADWARELGLSPSGDLAYLREFDHLTLARLLLAQYRTNRDTDALQQAIGLLERLLQAAQDSVRAGSVLEIRLLQALVEDAQGHRDAAAELRRRAWAEVPEPAGYPHLSPIEPDPLSDRELQVLRLLAGPLTGPEIARELYVSLNTVRSHTKSIFTKLGANSRPAAVRRARERGLL